MNRVTAAIIGSPNTGKSTFFNKLIGKKLSIVHDERGVTRDRIYGYTQWRNHEILLIDTGGIETDSKDEMMTNIRQQADVAIELADVIIFLVDGKAGLTSGDREIAMLLKKTRKKILLVVNKIDNAGIESAVFDFYELGFNDVQAVSAANMLGLGDVLDFIVDNAPKAQTTLDEDILSVAVIGRPNAGKSSLLNYLASENRAIVSEMQGTTRDSIDEVVTYKGDRYNIIDTAGIRRKSKIGDAVEKFSVIRAISAIERCDVCVLMIDANIGVSEQDQRIAGLAKEAGKGIIVAVNKWDSIKKATFTMKTYEREFAENLKFISYAPVVFISATEGIRIDNLMSLVKRVAASQKKRIKTSILNSMLADAMYNKEPPSTKGKKLKIYYVSQVGTEPPLFAFSINDKDLMKLSYSRYLENRIRDTFEFIGSPIKFVFRDKEEGEK